MHPKYNFLLVKKKPRHKLERHKWCCVHKLIIRAVVGLGLGHQDASIPDVHAPLVCNCLDMMRDLDLQIFDSYGSISMDAIGGSDTEAFMMLLDGSFLLHRLLMCWENTSIGSLGPCQVVRVCWGVWG
uniref:Uncharacterized protein n=1 Tax=Arundo donax TaxID=35708 RepID=A0A0A9BZV6_ARUDO